MAERSDSSVVVDYTSDSYLVAFRSSQSVLNILVVVHKNPFVAENAAGKSVVAVDIFAAVESFHVAAADVVRS